jgi:competence ComEA-like helix-hairpin-helix protein
MTSRERVVLIVLTATFLVGAGISAYRNLDRSRRASISPIAIENPIDTSECREHVVNLNCARRYELEALPGIGPALAGRILAYREKCGGFTSKRQLRNIAGIGPKRYAALSELVSVEPFEAAESSTASGGGTTPNTVSDR